MFLLHSDSDSASVFFFFFVKMNQSFRAARDATIHRKCQCVREKPHYIYMVLQQPEIAKSHIVD